MEDVSLKWNEYVKEVNIFTNDYQYLKMSGLNISWPLVEQYPSCHTLDLFETFNVEDITPLQIFFAFDKVKNMSVTLLTEERNKATFRLK